MSRSLSLVPRRSAGVWGAALCWAVALVALPCSAQPTISQDTATASAPLSTAQIGQIDGFIAFWLNELAQAESTDEVRRARNQIVTQITLPQTSDAFREAFVRSLVTQAQPLLTGGPLVVRLNTMIVMSRARLYGVLELAGQVLGDQNPAVRYWAAKTIEDVISGQPVDGPPLPRALRQQLLTALQQAAAKEAEPATLAQIFSAMAALGAINEVIQALDSRLPGHVENPDGLLLPERRAMEQLYIELVRQLEEQGRAAVEPTIIQLARVSLLYLTVASEQLAGAEQMGAELIEDKRRMVEQADLVLRWAVEQLGQAGVLPPTIRNAVATSDWGAIVGQLDFWRQELTLDPFNFRPGQLDPADASE